MTKQRLQAYIGIGSNLSDPLSQVHAGFAALAMLPESVIERVSSAYRSAPIGDPGQPDFINAVCRIATALSADNLMRNLLAIERERGRVRQGPKGGPRILDLDLLLYGQVESQSPDVILPHPRLHERAFVLYPLAEIEPDLVVPGYGAVKNLLATCTGQKIEKLEHKLEYYETLSE